MSTEFDKNIIEEYIKMLGKEKTRSLFQDFQKMAEENFIKNASLDEMRIIYHNLRSAGKAFGMNGFSETCEDIENKIIEGQSKRTLEIDIKTAKILFNNESAEVIEYFEKQVS